MRLLVCCEESQAVTLAFREYGVDAFSCDLKPCSGGYPDIHFQADCFDILNRYSWDMFIAHPPCTYLTKASSHLLFPGGTINSDRYAQGLAARDFFLKFYDIDIPHAIENPIPMKIFDLPKYSQIVSPHEYGDFRSKRTCLWLHGLPFLMPILSGFSLCVNPVSLVFTAGGSGSVRQCNRSKTSPFLARAMAEQWYDCT